MKNRLAPLLAAVAAVATLATPVHASPAERSTSADPPLVLPQGPSARGH